MFGDTVAVTEQCFTPSEDAAPSPSSALHGPDAAQGNVTMFARYSEGRLTVRLRESQPLPKPKQYKRTSSGGCVVQTQCAAVRARAIGDLRVSEDLARA